MDYLLIALVILNMALTVFLLLKVHGVQSLVSSFEVEYSTTESHSEGLLKNQKRITIYGQLKMGKLPIGRPFVFSEQVIEKSNVEQIERLLKAATGPLASLGIRFVSKGILR